MKKVHGNKGMQLSLSLLLTFCIFLFGFFLSLTYVHAECNLDNNTYNSLSVSMNTSLPITANTDSLIINITSFPLSDYRQNAINNLQLIPKDYETENFLSKYGLLETALKYKPETDSTGVYYDKNVLIKILKSSNLLFNLDVKSKINLHLFMFNDKNVKTLEQLHQEVIENNIKFTEPTKYADIDNMIKSKSAELTKNKNVMEAAFSIANYVKKNVKYDASYGSKIVKASDVLKEKKGTCDEFTNLFIALCRASGIPARYIGGLAYSNIVNDFVEHAWAEVYFGNYNGQELWVPFDPTFGQFGWIDTSHIALMKSNDASTASAQYNYVGTLDVGKMKTKTQVTSCGKKLDSVASIKIKPYLDHIKSGSYLPVEVIAKNIQPYYIALPVYLTKAPSKTQDSEKILLLKPFSTTRVYFVVYIPETTRCKLGCKSRIQVESPLSNMASTEITFSAVGQEITKEDAYSIANIKNNIDMTCYFTTNTSQTSNASSQPQNNDDIYYGYEKMIVKCIASSDTTSYYNMCLNIKNSRVNNCKSIILDPTPRQFNFSLGLSNIGGPKRTICIEANKKGEEKMKEKSICNSIDVLPTPDIKLIQLNPEYFNYTVSENAVLIINVSTPVKAIITITSNKTKGGGIIGKKETILKQGTNKIGIELQTHKVGYGNKIINFVIQATDLKQNTHTFTQNANIFIKKPSLGKMILIKIKAFFHINK